LRSLILAVLLVHPVHALTWITYNKSNSGLISDQVYSVCIDNYSAKWFGTDAGLSRFDGQVWSSYTTADRLAGDRVNDIYFEQSSFGPEIWLATDNGVTVMSVEPDAITMATPYRQDNTGLISNSVNAVTVDAAHIRWFGTRDGLSSFKGSEWGSYTIEDHLSANDIRALTWDTLGWRYAGTTGGGVSRLRWDDIDGVTSASPYDYAWSGLLSDNILSAYIDAQGIQWFGTDRGAAQHDTIETKAGWEVYTTEEGLVNDIVLSIVQGPQGRIWFGTEAGVSVFDGATFISYTVEDGLAGNRIHDMAVDDDGALWLATDQGVSCLATGGSRIEEETLSPRSFTLLRNYPNPFNASTQIVFTLQARAQVELEIYDLRGQRIRNLIAGQLSSGEHTVKWDGNGGTDGIAPTGVYLALLRLDGVPVASHKMLILR